MTYTVYVDCGMQHRDHDAMIHHQNVLMCTVQLYLGIDQRVIRMLDIVLRLHVHEISPKLSDANVLKEAKAIRAMIERR